MNSVGWNYYEMYKKHTNDTSSLSSYTFMMRLSFCYIFIWNQTSDSLINKYKMKEHFSVTLLPVS